MHKITLYILPEEPKEDTTNWWRNDDDIIDDDDDDDDEDDCLQSSLENSSEDLGHDDADEELENGELEDVLPELNCRRSFKCAPNSPFDRHDDSLKPRWIVNVVNGGDVVLGDVGSDWWCTDGTPGDGGNNKKPPRPRCASVNRSKVRQLVALHEEIQTKSLLETINEQNILNDVEYDLEQKIELEIKMREGSTRLLAACKHQAQSLEAAKSLLTSTERMSAYMAELQRRKRVPRAPGSSAKPATAKVSLSDLRMPLIWRDTDHFKNKGDYRRFAVFCLARVGTEIYDTGLLCPVDRSLTDITFPDTLIFNNVSPDFEFTLEIYSHILQDDLSMASTPRKIKKTIHSSISRTVGKKLAASLKDELNSGKIGPNFELMASARLTLDSTHDSIHTHDLITVNHDSKSHQLPLFGHFCCRLAVQPDCVTQEVLSGNLTIHDSTHNKWQPSWCQLQGFHLNVWEKREHWEKSQIAIQSVPINRDTTVQLSKTSSREFFITNLNENKEETVSIKAKTKEEQQLWTKAIMQHTKDHLRWQHAAEEVMSIQMPENNRHSFTRQLRQGSLYDETPLIETIQTENHRPTVQEIFALTPSTSLSSCASSSSSPTFRERSLSSGGSGKSSKGSSSLRAHWPFYHKD